MQGRGCKNAPAPTSFFPVGGGGGGGGGGGFLTFSFKPFATLM